MVLRIKYKRLGRVKLCTEDKAITLIYTDVNYANYS